ncbi:MULTISPECIES: cytochrome C biogenesis protein [Oceanotoga]|jgi:hypothetical protein|uniref:Cytochrome C biogenesis protein n=1 Tax=Oceanotoga teriensis TaxID=515440 RepID=A0AA45HHN5_9BACT|nr:MULTISPECIES: cytochrome C biogenesis protein [Oceanotoga]MDN5341848.1 hypothetical protein [Oceanotoga sp.]MDO7976671.1 hypothetical protein [Oceanotoga teriensis]PWJ86999.1 hypothetical protein C7380_1273 [Oceanotoga teriensis]
MNFNFFKLEIFIPEGFLDIILKSLNETGAAKAGNYDSCISYSKVIGMWRPLEGTNPYIGKINELSIQEEIKIECICKKEFLEKTVENIKKVHPYEEPVINIIPLIMNI